MTERVDAMSVDCPSCGAPVGEPCFLHVVPKSVLYPNERKCQPHLKRVELARKRSEGIDR